MNGIYFHVRIAVSSSRFELDVPAVIHTAMVNVGFLKTMGGTDPHARTCSARFHEGSHQIRYLHTGKHNNGLPTLRHHRPLRLEIIVGEMERIFVGGRFNTDNLQLPIE